MGVGGGGWTFVLRDVLIGEILCIDSSVCLEFTGTDICRSVHPVEVCVIGEATELDFDHRECSTWSGALASSTHKFLP